MPIIIILAVLAGLLALLIFKKLNASPKFDAFVRGVTEEQAMIDAQVQMASEVANGLAKIPVPAIVMGGGGSEGGDLTSSLINLKLMVDSGILDKMGIDSKAIQRVIDRSQAGAATK